MKKALLVATTMLSLSFTSMPALAGPNDDIPLNPLTNVEDMTPQEVCEALLRPNDPNSQFQTEPVDVQEGSWVNDGPAYPTTSAGSPSGYGTPTWSSIFLTSGFYRNGGSPNVWGGATATATYPQTQQLFNFSQDQTLTNTFGCAVWKDPGGPNHGPDSIYPPGLQSSGNSTVDSQTIDAVPAVQNVITDDDFIVTGQTVYTLICISPNNATKSKPGTWTQKHGFTGSCSAASLAAGTSFIPSGNAPIVD